MTLQRSEFKRKRVEPGTALVPVKAPKPPKGPRMRKCKVCREPFQPRNMSHAACNVDCALELAKQVRTAQELKAHKARKVAAKTRMQWLKEAQAVFNAYIRARDEMYPCISCGRWHDGQWHAGHYRSVGAQPALRFDERNVHKQCAPCNTHKSGNIVEYRISLIRRHGQRVVDILETEHPPAKYTIADAQRIIAVYKAKIKDLEKNGAPALQLGE